MLFNDVQGDLQQPVTQRIQLFLWLIVFTSETVCISNFSLLMRQRKINSSVPPTKTQTLLSSLVSFWAYNPVPWRVLHSLRRALSWMKFGPRTGCWHKLLALISNYWTVALNMHRLVWACYHCYDAPFYHEVYYRPVLQLKKSTCYIACFLSTSHDFPMYSGLPQIVIIRSSPDAFQDTEHEHKEVEDLHIRRWDVVT